MALLPADAFDEDGDDDGDEADPSDRTGPQTPESQMRGTKGQEEGEGDRVL